MSSAAGMVQIRPGVAEYDLPRGEEQARIEGAPSDNARGRQIENTKRR